MEDTASEATTPHRPAAATLPALDGYGPMEEIGRGGMGVVYKAYNAALGRHEAVKVLRAGASARDLERFRFEAEAAAGLRHDNILPVYRTAEQDGQPVLVTPWIAGGTLAAHAASIRGRPREIARMVALAARAVHHAHQRGILHRDLKPANILLDLSGEGPVPLVADFGLARWLGEAASQASAGVAGTPAYMAPEQAQGRADLSVAVDVYGLGGVLYHLLAGRAPFQGESQAELLSRVIAEEPVEPSAIAPHADRDLEAVCLKCLRKDPAGRYPSALALAEDLESYLAGRGVAARPPGPWEWLRQAWERTPPPAEYTWQVPVLMGLALLLSHAAVYLLIRRDGPAWAAAASVAAGLLLIWAVMWHGSLGKFRQVPVTQHTAAMVGLTYWLASWAVLVGYSPASWSAPAGDLLAAYPALTAVCGVSHFVLGFVFWGRMLASGAAMLLLGAAIRWTGDLAPLIHSAVMSAAMFWWSWNLRFHFTPKALTPPPTA